MTNIGRDGRGDGRGGQSGVGGGPASSPPASSSFQHHHRHHHSQSRTLGPDDEYHRHYYQQDLSRQRQRSVTPSSSSARTSGLPPTPDHSESDQSASSEHEASVGSPPHQDYPGSGSFELQEGVVEMGGISRQQKAFYGPYHDHEYDDDDDEDAAAAAAAPAGRKDSFGYGSCGSDKDDPDGGPDLAAAEAPASGTGSGRASASDPGDVQLYTLEEERAIVKKFDRKLVLFMALLYMLNFLDRSNIGNARIAGMEEDLQSTPRRDGWYEWALTGFYIAYIIFEWMAVLWKVVPAHIYVSVIVFSWGVIASLQAIAVNYPMLIFLRVLLGISEAAFTGVPFYLSFFFKRHELAFRTAMFISAAPLSSTFASTLAWLIVKLGESSPIAPWRLLFLLEGFPSVFVAVLAWSQIPDSPQTAQYLTPREKRVAHLRLRDDVVEPHHNERATSELSGRHRHRRRLDPLEVLRILADPVAWAMSAIFFLTNMAYSSLPVFLPTILESMGHDHLTSQALAAPPYLFAFVLVLVAARASDRARARGLPIALLALFSAAGYGALALSAGRVPAGSPARYAAVFPAAAGFFGVVALTISWTVNNQRSSARRGAGFALLQAVGQCGPLVGARLYPDAHAPFYQPGMAVCACAMLAVAALALGLRFYLSRLNKREGKEGSALTREPGGVEEEEGLVGPRRGAGARTQFVYIL